MGAAGLTDAAARAADEIHTRECANLIEAADQVAAIVDSVECKLDRRKTRRTGPSRASIHLQHLISNSSNWESELTGNASRVARRRPPQRALAPSANAACPRPSYPMRASDMQSRAHQQWSHVRRQRRRQEVERMRENTHFPSSAKMCLRMVEMNCLPVRVQLNWC
jgi:hypothetical protein